MELADKTEQEFNEWEEFVNGLITIGSAESTAARILSEILESFSQKYTLVQYNIFTGKGKFIEEITLRKNKGIRRLP